MLKMPAQTGTFEVDKYPWYHADIKREVVLTRFEKDGLRYDSLMGLHHLCTISAPSLRGVHDTHQL